MTEVKQTIIDYLTEELHINTQALASYEGGDDPIKNRETSDEIKKMREIEAIKLRDRIHETTRHIAVIKRMIV
ncbi:hypothetical protein [Pelobium manganitolerans]|nr:hypothetical protein [Pelobium manganitolerans]